MTSVTLTLSFPTRTAAAAFLGQHAAAGAVLGGLSLPDATSTDTAAVDTPQTGVATGEAKRGPGRPPKSAEMAAPAASTPPAAEAKSKPAATSASEKKADAPVAPVSYDKTGIAEKMSAYLGEKSAAGYAERRANLVGLLQKYGVAKGPELKADQFTAFATDLAALSAPAETEDDIT